MKVDSPLCQDKNTCTRLALPVAGVVLVTWLIVGTLAAACGLMLRKTPESPEIPEGAILYPLENENLVQIAVATHDIPQGMLVTEEANTLAMQAWPEWALPNNAIFALEVVYDRIARFDIPAGIPVTDNMLTDDCSKVPRCLEPNRFEKTELTALSGYMIDIVVSAQNIPSGLRISEDHGALRIARWPIEAIPQDTLTNIEDAYGRVTLVDIARDMPIVANMLGEP